MKVLVSGEVHVDYGQIFVESGGDECDLHDAFAGQEGVGLCGGGTDGALLLLTGLRVGGAGFTVELHDSRPALDETWEEIVEVPFRPVFGGDETAAVEREKPVGVGTGGARLPRAVLRHRYG